MQPPETPQSKKTFAEHFNEFATSTAFHGFVQYELSTNWLKQSLWLTLILLCTGLTIRDLRASLRQFLDEDLQSTTTIVRSQRLAYPNASICIEFNTSALDYHGVDVHNLANISHYFSEQKRLLRDLFVGGTCYCNDSRHRYDVHNDRNVRTAVFLVVSMLAQLTSYESPYLQNENRLDANETYKFFTSQETPANFSQLLQRAGLWMCRIVNLVAIYVKQDTAITDSIDICEEIVLARRTVFWIGAQPAERTGSGYASQICFGLPEVIEFTSWDRSRIIVMFNEYDLYRRNAELNGTETRETSLKRRGAGNVHFRFTGSDVAFSNRTSGTLSISLANKWHTSYNVQQLSIYQQYKRRVAPECGETPYILCIREKLALQFVSACGCFPFSWSHFYDYTKHTTRLCSDPSDSEIKLPGVITTECENCTNQTAAERVPFVIASKCLAWLGTAWADPAAERAYYDQIASCLPTCQEVSITTNYDMDNDQPLELVKALYGDFVTGRLELEQWVIVSLRVAEFTYVTITEEEPKVNVDTLFSNIGGNLSMWLGGSFIALIHLVVSVIEYLIHKAVPQRAQTETLWSKRIGTIVGDLQRDSLDVEGSKAAEKRGKKPAVSGESADVGSPMEECAGCVRLQAEIDELKRRLNTVCSFVYDRCGKDVN